MEPRICLQTRAEAKGVLQTSKKARGFDPGPWVCSVWGWFVRRGWVLNMLSECTPEVHAGWRNFSGYWPEFANTAYPCPDNFRDHQWEGNQYKFTILLGFILNLSKSNTSNVRPFRLNTGKKVKVRKIQRGTCSYLRHELASDQDI